MTEITSTLPQQIATRADDGSYGEGVRWSAPFAPPAIGSRIVPTISGIGASGIVRAYFVEHGWLGLYVELEDMSERLTKQNHGNPMAYLFGAEVRVADEQPGELADWPTGEQLAALQDFADRHPTNWREQLNDAWMNGRDACEPSGALLRQVRNHFGPSWLFDECKLEPLR